MEHPHFESVADFLFEAGILAKTPRSGFHFLGSGKQSVAEHLNRTAYVGFVLATMHGEANVGKVIQMCLFHDFTEGRTSDLNYVHQKYVHTDEKAVLKDLVESVHFGDQLRSIIEEYEARETLEAKLAKDADNLEWILSLKEVADTGNSRALEWINFSIKRLKTDIAKRLGETIINRRSDAWWFKDKEGDWWVNRNKGSDASSRTADPEPMK